MKLQLDTVIMIGSQSALIYCLSFNACDNALAGLQIDNERCGGVNCGGLINCFFRILCVTFCREIFVNWLIIERPELKRDVTYE